MSIASDIDFHLPDSRCDHIVKRVVNSEVALAFPGYIYIYIYTEFQNASCLDVHGASEDVLPI
jgi:hypothetical protein